ncbi:ankyrin repeat domain-containing protein [Marinomonas sp. THO17]|uniref:ankyrin repeat domain-containing protein n=1 Tax=Marinomonas sp. THO17 TaxID=3149048 RepID=UPI00336BB2CF
MNLKYKWKYLIAFIFTFTLQACSVFSPYTSQFQGIKERIVEGQDINESINENGDTYLHQSVENNASKEVAYLLKHGANPNLSNAQGLKPINLLNKKQTVASDKEQAKILSLLGQYGADVNALGINGKTPIIEAVLNNKPESVKALLKYKANLDISYQSNTPLMLAVQSGDKQVVDDLIAVKQQFNSTNQLGYTAINFTALAETNGSDQALSEIAKSLLIAGVRVPESYKKDIISQAIQNRRPQVARLLMAAGETPSSPNRDDFTPLMDAVYTGHKSRVKTLLKEGADPNSVDTKGWTALLLCAHQDSNNRDDQQASIAKLLLKYGAMIDQVGPNKNSALNLAIDSGRDEIADLLIDEHININSKNAEGETALIKAIQTNNIQHVEQLLSPETLISKDNYLWTPLHFSTILPDINSQQDTSIMALLLTSKIDINAQNNQGETPLFLAIKYGKTQNALLLLSHNADADIADVNGVTPLMQAAQANNLALVTQLISVPQDLNRTDKNGQTALHFATQIKAPRNDYQRAEIIRLLINAGANPNIQNNNLSTPLHLSVRSNLLQSTRALVKADTLPNIQNHLGNTALINAVQNGNLPIVEELAQQASGLNFKQNNGWAALHFTAHPDSKGSKETQAKIASTLIKAGADINLTIPTGETSLSIAIGNNQQPVIKALLAAKARVDIQDSNGWTPLMFAVYLGQVDTVKAAIQYTKNLNIKNNDGLTALHLTTNPSSLGGVKIQSEIAKMLIEKGANINVQASDGSTPLHFAASNGLKDMVKVLLAKNASSSVHNLRGWTARDEALKANNADIAYLLQ